MSLLDNLPHLATAKVRRREKDEFGGTRDNYPTILFSDRPCWRQGLSATEIELFQHRDMKVTHKVFFATDPGLDEGHVLVIGGDTMTVRSAAHPDSSAGLGVLWRIEVELVR